jgi:hypothetical protein
LLQLDSALAESKADTRFDTLSTFHAARFWSNADAVWNSCERTAHYQKTSLRPHGSDSRPNAPAARKGTMEVP